METLYYVACIAAAIGAFFVYNIQMREDKLNLRIEMLSKMQTEHGDNCLKGIADIKETLKEIKAQIDAHTATNTALSIEMERIKSNMDGVVGKVEQMERLFEAVLTSNKRFLEDSSNS